MAIMQYDTHKFHFLLELPLLGIFLEICAPSFTDFWFRMFVWRKRTSQAIVIYELWGKTDVNDRIDFTLHNRDSFVGALTRHENMDAAVPFSLIR